MRVSANMDKKIDTTLNLEPNGFGLIKPLYRTQLLTRFCRRLKLASESSSPPAEDGMIPDVAVLLIGGPTAPWSPQYLAGPTRVRQHKIMVSQSERRCRGNPQGSIEYNIFETCNCFSHEFIFSQSGHVRHLRYIKNCHHYFFVTTLFPWIFQHLVRACYSTCSFKL